MFPSLTGRRRRQLNQALYMLVLGVLTWFWLIPAVWSLSMSFKPEVVLRRSTAGLLPIPFTLKNYSYMLSSGHIQRWFLNSAVVCVSRTLLVLVVNGLAGYAFACIPFKGKRIIFPVVLAGIMVPSQAFFIPIYLMIARMHWHNTYAALILPTVATSFGVFLLTSFFKRIPRELQESAMLDGAGPMTIFLRIILPLSKPVFATLGIFTFLGSWNDFLWPLISTSKLEMMTITVGLPLLVVEWDTAEFLGRMMAGAWIAGIPIVILFLVFQRHLIRGIALEGSF